MKFTFLIRSVLAFVFAFLLGSCGGGGATTITNDLGPLAINPPAATWYAGVMNTLTISGGSPPFTLSSSEPSLLPLPITLNGRRVDVVPANPSVVDAGLPPEALPVRTVNITARSAEGLQATAAIQVGQNFLTGYGFAFSSTICGNASPCAGGESAVIFDATLDGNIRQNRVFRIERVRGPFQFVDPLNSNNQTDAVTVVSDHEGKFVTVIRVATGVPNQIGIFKIVDVATGAYVLRTFPISAIPATGIGAFTIIPSTILLTGPDDKTCGFGRVDVLVFDGQPPYTASCPNAQILVVNQTSNEQPGRFQFFVGPSNQCLNAEQCVITDSTGGRQTFAITTVKGVAPTPPPTLTATPSSFTLTCGASGSVTVTGGTGNYSVNSTHPRVVATVSGNTVTITRLAGPDPAGGPFATSAIISITDGSQTAPVNVTVPASC